MSPSPRLSRRASFRWIAFSLISVNLTLFLFANPALALPYVKATFAGGCFWCMQKPFDEIPGVKSTTAGYTGGNTPNPTYKQVSSGSTGHAEAVEVLYDPAKVSYETLLNVFWRNVDPLDGGGQFCDRGSQYRSSIFYHTEEQRILAEKSKQAAAQQLKKPIQTTIVSAKTFYAAEGYHQSFYKTNAVKYNFYRFTCGRDQRLKQVWGQSPH